MAETLSDHGPSPPVATRDEIQQVVDTIATCFYPQRVVLFGSYATGQAGPDSDIDLLVIMPTPLSPIRQAVHIAQAVEHHFPLDIVVRTPEQVSDAGGRGDALLREVLTTGVTVYAAPDSGVGCQGRRGSSGCSPRTAG